MADPSEEVTLPPPDPPDPPNPNTNTSISGGTMGPPSNDPPSSSPTTSSSSSPPWVVWSKGLHALLEDPQGQDLFKTFLEEEGCSSQLTFLWACAGLRHTENDPDPSKIPELVKKIYRFFLPNLIGLSDSTRGDLAQAIEDERFTEVKIFNKAEEEVLLHMRENLYPNFLKSELYLSACNGEDCNGGSSSGSNSGRERRQSEGEDSSASLPDDGDHVAAEASSTQPLSPFLEPSTRTTNQLQTVHEDTELSMAAPLPPLPPLPIKLKKFPSSSQSQQQQHLHFGLTKEALLRTEHQRAGNGNEFKGSKTESTAARFSKHKQPPATGVVPFPYHASYSSYNPVSRVDSEIQSLSSDAMTDDGSTCNRRRHGHRQGQDRQHGRSDHCREMGRGGGGPYPSNPDRNRRQPLNPGDDLKKLHTEGHVFSKLSRSTGPDPEKEPEKFAQVLMEKLRQLEPNRVSQKDILVQAIRKIHSQEEESPNDIIDDHFDRVPYFADITPKSKSPTGRRRGFNAPQPFPAPPARRRDKDFVVSTFSIDSGNVPDAESLVFNPSTGEARGLQKSRSVPHELRAQPLPLLPFSSGNPPPPRGHPHHYPHPPSGGRGLPSKLPYGHGLRKPTSMEFVDSGISTVSGPSIKNLGMGMGMSQSSHPSVEYPYPQQRVHDWVVHNSSQSDRQNVPLGSFPSSSQSQRRSRKPRTPPELEDVREKLVQALDFRSGSGNNGANVPRHSPPSSSDTGTTVIVQNSNCVHTYVSYEDDNSGVPTYALKIPKGEANLRPASAGSGSGVTLGALKERLPRQGLFRYYFRTECPDMGTVQEEISENFQELPMLNGKIFAHLKAVPGTSNSGMPTQI